MGDLQKTVKILFYGDDQISRTIKSLSRNLSSLGHAAEDIGEPFKTAAQQVAVLELAILSVAAAGVKARSDLEQEANRMSNALGLPVDKAQEFEDVAKRVYTSGFGDDLTESFNAVTVAVQKFSDQSADGIESIVTNAKKIQSTFGVDVSESLSGVRTLMDNFGLSSEQAFDFIVAGYQKGLNGSGDFIESINEYATQFKNGGADAGQFFSVLESGFQEGMLGTDRAADAFKEFRVRIQDGSKTTSDALAQIGLGDEFTDSLAKGEITAIQAFGTVIDRLNATENRSIQLQAGVGLIGTQFEDLGTDAALALSTTITNIDDLKGKIDAIEPNETLGKKFVSMMRTIRLAIIDDDVWGGIENDLSDKFDDIKDNFVEAWEDLKPQDFQALLDSFDDLFNALGKSLDAADIDLKTAEGIKKIIHDVIDSVKSINEISTGIVEAISPIIGWIADVTRAFNSLSPSIQSLIGNVLGLGAALATVGGALVAGGGIIGGISRLTTMIGVGGLYGQLSLLVAHPAFSLLASGSIGWAIGTEIRNLFPIIDAVTQKMWRFVDSIVNFSGQKGNVDLGQNMESVGWNAENAAGKIDKIPTSLNKIPDKTEKTFTLEGVEYTREELKRLLDEQKSIADIKSKIEVKSNVEKVEQEFNVFKYKLEDGTWAEIIVETDKESLDKAAKEVTDKKDAISILKIETEMDKAKLEAAVKVFESVTDVMTTKIEWDAKIDIAQIEADAEKTIAAFDSIGDSVVAVTDVVGGMFSDLATLESGTHFYDLLNVLNREMGMQEKLIDSQIKLIDAQIEAMQRGDAIFTINGENLSQGARAFMYEILKEIQVEMSGAASSYLMGVA